MFPLKQNNNLRQTENDVWVIDPAESFAYSEGDEAEEYIRACLESVDDLSVDSVQLQEKIKDWSSEYHLSPARANLVRSLRLDGMESVLELGSGCGAISRYLGEQGCLVEAVEGSPVRAEFTRKRCRDLTNVHVINANFNVLTLPDNQYDAIFLIGVLEYAAMFLPGQENSRESLISILKIVQKALKPDGILVVAIENRMGLKYWSGAGEDHFGERDIGLYGYPAGDGIQTYDKREWEDIVADAGDGCYTFVYPFPDYKLPRVLMSDDFVARDPHAYSLLNRISSTDPLTGWEADDDEFLRWKVLHQSRYLGEFANSFLIVLSTLDSAVLRAVPFDFVHFSSEGRKLQFRTATEKLKNARQVVKRRIKSIQEGETQCSGCISQSVHDTTYTSGPMLTTLWIEACCRKELEPGFTELLQRYLSFVQEHFDKAEATEFLIDLLPSNIVVTGHPPTYEVIDQEWGFSEHFDVDFVLFRALLWFGYHNRFLLSRFNQDKPWQTVGDFVGFCFASLALPLQPRIDEFVVLEDRIHAEIALKGMPFSANAILQTRLQEGLADTVAPENALRAPEQDVKGPDTPSVPTGMKGDIFFFTKRLYNFVKRIRYQTNSHYRALIKSGLFDERYYISNDPGLDPRYTHPLIHYLELGWQEGRDPNPLFDSAYYCRMNPECTGTDPLLHYVQSGWKEGAKPMPFFFTSWYAAEYPESVRAGGNPLSHYLQIGWKEGKKPNPYMDFSAYIEKHPGLTAEDLNPLAHYVDHGFGDPSGPLPFFDADFYLEDSPFAAKQRLSLLGHYAQYGVSEGRSPNRFFDPAYYLATYEEAGPDQLTAFLHFNASNWQQNFHPNPLFDAAFYAEMYPEFRDTHPHPLLHYQQSGVFKGLYPCRQIADFTKKPVVSIITPVFNTDELLLRRCIHSVLFQAYPHWELCLVDDGSVQSHVREILEEYERLDHRIKIQFLDGNNGISKASNEAAKMATGEYLGFLDHDDELTGGALYEIVRAINDCDPDLIYTDEDLVNLESRNLDSFFKPDYNAELLLNHNYITHFLVTRAQLFARVNGLSAEYDGAQDYDLVLKLTEQAKTVHHIAKPLYHWRASDTSTSINHTQKVYADAAGKKALQAAIDRRGVDAEVGSGEWRFFYRARRKIKDSPAVALIMHIAPGDSLEEVSANLSKYFQYKPLEIHCICNGYSGAGKSGTELFAGSPVHVHEQGEGVRSLAEVYNKVVSKTSVQHLLFMRQDVEPSDSGWIEALLEYSQEESVGMVTGYIDDAGEKKRSDDMLPDLDNKSWRQYRRFFLNASRHLNSIYCQQDILAASVDLCMVKRDLFEKVGGFDEDIFRFFFFDMDLSLRLRRLGAGNVYTPYCRTISKAKGEEIINDEDAVRELNAFKRKWHPELKHGDPYYNPGKLLAEKHFSMEQWLEWFSGHESD